MAFTSYKNITDVLQAFVLDYQEQEFIELIIPHLDQFFLSRLNLVLQEGIVYNSEYAICENIISPILTEIWRSYTKDLLIWSHQPLNCDENLSGTPDYIVARRSPRGKIILEKPYVILVEAKKDNFEEGWGQCFAEMIAAQKLNGDSDEQPQKLFGVVSNGKLWEFGVLQAKMFTKNIKYFGLQNVPELMGALNFIFVESLPQQI